jgi:hypothetical protein
MRKYRFFYHYFKGKGAMSVHFRGQCYVVNNVKCDVPCETKWKPTQPKLIMQGFASDVAFDYTDDLITARIM